MGPGNLALIALQIVTCPQCGHKSGLRHDEIVGLGDMLECGNPNCGRMFQPDDENTVTLTQTDGRWARCALPDYRGPTEEELRKA
jgi:hypothetical protein